MNPTEKTGEAEPEGLLLRKMPESSAGVEGQVWNEQRLPMRYLACVEWGMAKASPLW